ncbi:MAG: inositol monophosphatase family protein, partial [Bowdeniella nasicola]|nr:inositol monophosphatase family protein [Bowdeniella nasicola]
AGSAALDLVAVAGGQLDGYFERGLQPWDYTAGAVIARAAGAEVGGRGNTREAEDLTWAVSHKMATEFRALLRDIGADTD